MSNPASSSKNILSKSGTDTGTLSFTNFTPNVGEGKIEFKHDPTGNNRQIKLKVDNNSVTISNKGAVSALSFHGDGSALTGISTNSVYSGNSNLTVISSGGDEYITLGTNNNERIRLTKDGKLGIGINNPSQLLDVDGVVKAKSFDGNSITIGFDSNYVKIANSIYNVNGITLTLPVNTGTSGQYLETDGSGNMSWSTVPIPDNDKIIKGESNVSVINNGSEQFISFTTNSSEKVRIISNGSVGIGLTNPAEKLDVNGTVKANKFMGDGSNLTNIVIGDASNSLHEQKKVSFRSSENIPISSISNASNVITISKNTETIGTTGLTLTGTASQQDGLPSNIIVIFHGTKFTKTGRLLSWNIHINDDIDKSKSFTRYVTPLIFEYTGTLELGSNPTVPDYRNPRYTLRGVGTSYKVFKTGHIKNIPFDLQVGSDQIKPNYTIGFVERHLVWNSSLSKYDTSVQSYSGSISKKNDSTMADYAGVNRWVYTNTFESANSSLIGDIFSTTSSTTNKGGIGKIISLDGDITGDVKIDKVATLATNNMIYWMDGNMIETTVNETRTIGLSSLATNSVDLLSGKLRICHDKTILTKGRLTKWRGYISAINKYITPVILSKKEDGNFAQYRIKGIGTSYTKSTIGDTGDVNFGLQVGTDKVDIGDTFGFIDKQLVWNATTSTFTTNNNFSGSVALNETSGTSLHNEWLSVEGNLEHFITNNVILDTVISNETIPITWDVDNALNVSLSYDSIGSDTRKNKVTFTGGTNSTWNSVDKGIRALDKITPTSNIIGLKFRLNTDSNETNANTINNIAVLLLVSSYSNMKFSLNHENIDKIGKYYFEMGPSGTNMIASYMGHTGQKNISGTWKWGKKSLFSIIVNRTTKKIDIYQENNIILTVPDTGTFEDHLGTNWEFIIGITDYFNSSEVYDMQYITELTIPSTNRLRYDWNKYYDRTSGDLLVTDNSGWGKTLRKVDVDSGGHWDSLIKSSYQITPDSDIMGVQFTCNVGPAMYHMAALNKYVENQNYTNRGYGYLMNSTFVLELRQGNQGDGSPVNCRNGGTIINNNINSGLTASYTNTTKFGMIVDRVGDYHYIRFLRDDQIIPLNITDIAANSLETKLGSSDWKLDILFGFWRQDGSNNLIENIDFIYRQRTYNINYSIESDEKLVVNDYIKIKDTGSSTLDNKFHKINNINPLANTVTIDTNANSAVSAGTIKPNYEEYTVSSTKGENTEVVLSMIDKSLSSGDHHLFVSWTNEFQNASPDDQILKIYYKNSAYSSTSSVSDGTLLKTIYQSSSNSSNNTTTATVFVRVPTGQTYFLRATRSSQSSFTWLSTEEDDISALSKIKNELIQIDYVTPGVSGARYNTIYKNNTRIELQDDSEDKLIKFTVDNSEKARIITNGNVGIGLTNPTEKLEVNGSVKATSFQGDGSGITNISVSSGNNIAQGDSKVEVLNSGSNGQIKFTTDNTEKMKIENDKISIFNNVELLSSGDVALKIKADTDNVDENDNALLVLSQDNDTVKMEMGGVGSGGQIYTNSLANAQYIMANSTNSSINTSLQLVTKDGSNPLTSRMTILHNGKVGLGTNNPGTVFEINDRQPYITLRNNQIEITDGGCESRIIFEDHGGNRLAQIQGSHDGTGDDTKGNLIFSTSNGIVVNEVMNINNDGNIRIGKTTNDSANVSGRLAIVANNSSTTDIEFRTDDSTVYNQDFPTAKIEAGFTSTSWNTAYLKFRTHASNAVGFTDDMIIRGGNVGIGTNDPKSLLEIKGSSPKLILRDNASNVPSIDFIRGSNTTFGADSAQDWQIKVESGNLIFFTQSTSSSAAGGTSGADILKLNWNERNYIRRHFEITQTDLGEWQNAHTYENQGLYFDYGGNKWNISYVSPNDLGFSYNGRHMAWLNGIPVNTAAPNVTTALNNFTGQHRSFINEYSLTELENLNGLIVSANRNNYTRMSNGIVTGNNAITINESLPDISITIKDLDKSVFGVISNIEDVDNRKERYGRFVSIMEKEVGDTRPYINSVGEGAIWVSDKNGNLESGDYITSCTIPGYGMKQNDDILHNYTVAKITMDCNFNPVTQSVRQILKDSDGNNILDSNGFVQWENHATETEKAYKIRYLLANGTQITEADYTTRKSNGENVYKAAFVGCTYHCG